MGDAKQKLVQLARERPLLAASVAFLHFPLIMGVWVMAAETLAGWRRSLARLHSSPERA